MRSKKGRDGLLRNESMQPMKLKTIHTRLFEEGENIERFILEHIPKLGDGSILVVTSKIVALAERRTATPEEKEKIILTNKNEDIETTVKIEEVEVQKPISEPVIVLNQESKKQPTFLEKITNWFRGLFG